MTQEDKRFWVIIVLIAAAFVVLISIPVLGYVL